MTRSASRRLEELFHRVRDLPPGRRERFLQAECADDPALRGQVERLLDGHARAPAGFLPGEEHALAPGDLIEGFEILAKLGEGGMGVIYAARQAFPRREVAIKVVRRGQLSERAVRRFRHEVQALGDLAHPGIARIYAAGATVFGGAEQPYLVMELVRGRPLLEHARAQRLGRRGRLELVARVCDAVHHAHQRGVIHRDLKPENVLVVPGEGDDVGQPKLLDFGIARLARAEATARQTLSGEVLGTLGYMSPEQVDGEPDVRTDVYAVGVLLYELLAGRPPLALLDVPFGEAVRRIREDDPPRPSTFDAGLRGDVDTILLRALEKRAERRYQSAAALAGDLRRHLRGEPIEARSDSTVYVLRRTFARHRALAVGGAAIVLAMAVTAVVSTVQSRANRALSLRLADELELSDVERGRMIAADGDLLQAEDLLWPAFLGNPGSRHVAWALWETYARDPCLGTWPVQRTLHGLELHPDGRRVAMGGDEGKVLLIDVDRPGLRTFHDAGDAIWDLAFSPDGTRLAAALEDGSVRLWSFPEGVSLRSLRVRGGAAMALVFPRDDLLVTGSESGAIEAWDPSADAASLGLGVLGGTVLALAFDPAAGRLACAGRGGEVLVLDAADRGPAIRIATTAHDVEALAFSADGGLLAWGGRDKAVHVWDTARREQTATLEVANGFTQDMAFRSGAAPALVTGGWSATLFWDVPGLRLSRRLGCPALELALGAEDGRLVTASSECRVWDLTSRGFEPLVPHAGRSACEFEPGGRRLATGDEDGVLRVWDVASARLLLERPLAPERIRSLSFQPGGPLLAAGNEVGSVTVLDAHTGELAFELTGHDEISAASVAFGPAGRLLAHTAEAGRVRVVDVRTRALVADVEADRPGGSRGYVESLGVAFHPEGRLFATTGRGLDRLRLWDLAGALRADVPIEGAPWTPAFSGDGRLVAVTTWSGAVQVLDATSGGTVMRLQEHQAVAWDVAFDPDDPGTLATSSDDGTVKLWDVAAGRRLATLRDHGEFECFAVSLGPGGLLASASRGGVVLRDLSYFQHHVAANLAYQRELRGREPGLTVDDDGLDAWAADIAARDWPRYDW